MLPLFNRHRRRFSRPARPRRNRVAATGIAPERLEQRLALDATVGRTLLEQASTLVMDQSMGPSPVVMTMQQVAGTEVKSFVISHVPEGSSVEKWDSTNGAWVDVSTMPSTANPLQLMKFLSSRTIKQGDTIQWRPKDGFAGGAQQAFQMINWDDGSELRAGSQEAPSEVQNLLAYPTGVGELTLTWDAPATGTATSYTVTMTTTTATGSTHQTQITANPWFVSPGLSTTNGCSFSVAASNAAGTGASFGG